MPGFTLTFSADGYRLFRLPHRQGATEVFGEAPHKFFLEVVDATIEFHPEAHVSVRAMGAGDAVPEPWFHLRCIRTPNRQPVAAL